VLLGIVGWAMGGELGLVDRTTLKGKVMCGYQGWFGAKGDGGGTKWVHYGNGKGELKPGVCSFDLWPDLSEFSKGEKYPTQFVHKDGRVAHLFSSRNRKTVMRHFKWMHEYGIAGVFLQRFGSGLRHAERREHCDRVMGNVQAGSQKYGRTWALMYDLSGLQKGEIKQLVIEDWRVKGRVIQDDGSYLHHGGKPVVAVWGIGFNDGRGYSLDECSELVKFLKEEGCTVMLGVPTGWRTLSRDAMGDSKLLEVIQLADIISPWSVGRFKTPEQAAARETGILKSDLEWAGQHDNEYLPFVFPGFSWQNLKKMSGMEAELNAIPRCKGAFLWAQVVAAKKAGAEMLYVAMFDEVDEATAIFKCTNDPPAGESRFLTYEGLPSDHYLWLAGKAGEVLREKGSGSFGLPSR